jgi:colanic acid/amylovoran biosynthesis glycosyltransferase
MRLAIIVNSFPEISEKFLLNHIIGEMISGVDVTVFAAHKCQAEKYHDSYYQYDVERKTEYLGIPRQIKKRFLAAPFLFLKLFFKNPKAALEAVNFKKYQTVAKNGKLLYFASAFRGKHFDVVHCHFGMNGLIGCYLKNCGFAERVVTTFHGADINLYPKRYGQYVYKTVYAQSDIVTANTEFTKAKIVANGCVPEKIKVIPVGLFVDDYKNSSGEKLPDSVLTVGRLEEKKGYRYSLEAVAIAKKTIPSLEYYIIGEGTLRNEMTHYAQELGIADCCHFLGAQGEAEVKAYYQRCEVFMLPSVTASNGDMEGQGLVLQEAQASGLPVISSLHNGIPEGVLDGKSGFLVPEKDSAALAEKIVLLINGGGGAMREKMGKAGKEFVAGKYDMPVIVGEFNALYNMLLEEKRAKS